MPQPQRPNPIRLRDARSAIAVQPDYGNAISNGNADWPLDDPRSRLSMKMMGNESVIVAVRRLDGARGVGVSNAVRFESAKAKAMDLDCCCCPRCPRVRLRIVTAKIDGTDGADDDRNCKAIVRRDR